MGSSRVQVFHDHVLVKEPGTSKATPWHQDGPYYFVDGIQNVSFWSPMDPVKGNSLRCVAGSHAWENPVLPTRWLAETNFYPEDDAYMPVPDPDAEGMDIREWEMEPGDAVAFNYGTLHGARGNTTNARRRAFSLRLVGDDARYVTRPGPTSPPFPGHGMTAGQKCAKTGFRRFFSAEKHRLPTAKPFPGHQRSACLFWHHMIALVLGGSCAGVVGQNAQARANRQVRQ